jgi:hypothetical protein
MATRIQRENYLRIRLRTTVVFFLLNRWWCVLLHSAAVASPYPRGAEESLVDGVSALTFRIHGASIKSTSFTILSNWLSRG